MDVAGGSALRGALLAALARGSGGEAVKKEPTAAGAAGERCFLGLERAVEVLVQHLHVGRG